MVKDTELQTSIMAAKARFEEKVNKKTGPLMPNMSHRCWQWLDKPGKQTGYGFFKFNNKAMEAHQFAWLLHGQPLPLPGAELHHACQNKLCVNPHHLAMLTDAAHRRLRFVISSATCPNGHPFDEVSPLIDGAGCRRCRECAKISRQRYNERRGQKHAA